MRSTKTGAAVVVAALGMIACGTSTPAGPVVHERHTVERGAAARARVEMDMSWINARAEGSSVTIDLAVQHAIGDLRVVAE